MGQSSGEHSPPRVGVRGFALLFCILSGASARTVLAQQPAASQDTSSDEITALRARLDSLEVLIADLRDDEAVSGRPEEDPAAALRAAAAEAAGLGVADTTRAAPEAQDFENRQRSLQDLNPEISLTGDVFGQLDSRSAGTDNFFPREFELSLISSLDPYSRAKVFVAHHEPGGELEPFSTDVGEVEEAGVEIEEGYAQWVGLPGGLSLTVGKFRQRFGTFNRWHAHALFFQSLPLPLQVFAGEEGIAQTGISAYWLLPVEGLGTYEFWLEPTLGSNERLFDDAGKLSVLAHANAFWELSPATYLELGLSGITGRYEGESEDFRQNLLGAEIGLNWRPPAQALFREILLRAGVMMLDPGGVRLDPEARERSFGTWSMVDYLFAQNWHVGARFDWVQNPDNGRESAWLAGPTLTWWQSEFVRLRAEYDLLGGADDTVGKLLLQVTFAMGPHKHETY